MFRVKVALFAIVSLLFSQGLSAFDVVVINDSGIDVNIKLADCSIGSYFSPWGEDIEKSQLLKKGELCLFKNYEKYLDEEFKVRHGVKGDVVIAYANPSKFAKMGRGLQYHACDIKALEKQKGKGFHLLIVIRSKPMAMNFFAKWEYEWAPLSRVNLGLICNMHEYLDNSKLKALEAKFDELKLKGDPEVCKVAGMRHDSSSGEKINCVIKSGTKAETSHRDMVEVKDEFAKAFTALQTLDNYVGSRLKNGLWGGLKASSWKDAMDFMNDVCLRYNQVIERMKAIGKELPLFQELSNVWQGDADRLEEIKGEAERKDPVPTRRELKELQAEVFRMREHYERLYGISADWFYRKKMNPVFETLRDLLAGY